MRRAAWVVATVLGGAGVLGCAGADPTEPVRAAPRAALPAFVRAAAATTPAAAPVAVRAETVLPAAFARNLAPEPVTRVIAPAGMVLVSTVIRPRAEMRNGPGVQYELADKVLELGVRVLTFARVGVWQKVLVLGTWQRGWVHSAALDRPVPSSVPLALDMRWLPTVVATHDVDTVQSYAPAAANSSLSALLSVAVPRGAQFRSLQLAETGTLVWLPQTNSVMWMSRKDVQ